MLGYAILDKTTDVVDMPVVNKRGSTRYFGFWTTATAEQVEACWRAEQMHNTEAWAWLAAQGYKRKDPEAP